MGTGMKPYMRNCRNEPTETSRPFAALSATARARLALDYINEPTEDAPTKSNEPSKSAKTNPLGGIADKCPERCAKDLEWRDARCRKRKKQTHLGAIVPIETLRFAQGDRSHTARGRLRNEAKSSRRIKHFRNERGWNPSPQASRDTQRRRGGSASEWQKQTHYESGDAATSQISTRCQYSSDIVSITAAQKTPFTKLILPRVVARLIRELESQSQNGNPGYATSVARGCSYAAQCSGPSARCFTAPNPRPERNSSWPRTGPEVNRDVDDRWLLDRRNRGHDGCDHCRGGANRLGSRPRLRRRLRAEQSGSLHAEESGY